MLELNLPGHSWSTLYSPSQGSNSLLYNSLPYAFTVSIAMTFCSISFVPDTSNLTFLMERSNSIFSLLTLMSPVPSRQELKPLVLRISAASTLSGADASNMKGASIAEYVAWGLIGDVLRPRAFLEGQVSIASDGRSSGESGEVDMRSRLETKSGCSKRNKQ
jgi:hypothetical protein